MIEFIVIFTGWVIGIVLVDCVRSLLNDKSFLYAVFRCPICQNRRGLYDLTPILSYLFLRGRCQSCCSKIPLRYLVLEILTPFLFYVSYTESNSYYTFCRTALFVCFGIIISYIDYEWQLILDKILIYMLSIGITLHFSELDLKGSILSSLVGGGILFTVFITSQGRMGIGDIKLAITLGAWLDWKAQVLGLFMAFVFGGLTGILLLIAKKKSATDAMPFGPFIMLGSFFSLLYGELILNWYLSLLYI